MKCRKKPVIVEYITFEQLVEHGRATGGNIVNGMPWSFDYKGHPITHENDDCYLIPTQEGTMQLRRGDLLITGVKGEIYPCKPDIFAETYETCPGCDGGCVLCKDLPPSSMTGPFEAPGPARR